MTEPKPTLLIVEDEDSIRFSLGQIFRCKGYAVRCAEDGAVALAELQSELPDILISDLHMPRMSGLELLELVRLRYPTIYVIGITGAFIDRLPRGIPADGFYRKAGSIDKLFQLVTNAAQMEPASLIALRRTTPSWAIAEESVVSGGLACMSSLNEGVRDAGGVLPDSPTPTMRARKLTAHTA